MAVNLIRNAGGAQFYLHLFEDKDAASKPNPSCDRWLVSHVEAPSIPSDEVKSFKLSGNKGLKVEFFRDKNFGVGQSWSEVTLTGDNVLVVVDQMDRSGGGYIKHDVNGDVGGKVDAIRITQT